MVPRYTLYTDPHHALSIMYRCMLMLWYPEAIDLLLDTMQCNILEGEELAKPNRTIPQLNAPQRPYMVVYNVQTIGCGLVTQLESPRPLAPLRRCVLV